MLPILAFAFVANLAALAVHKGIQRAAAEKERENEQVRQLIDQIERGECAETGQRVWIYSRFEEPRDPEDFLVHVYEVRLDQRTVSEFQSPRHAAAVARALASRLRVPLDLEGAYAWKVTGPFGYVRQGTLPEYLRPSL